MGNIVAATIGKCSLPHTLSKNARLISIYQLVSAIFNRLVRTILSGE